MARRLRIEMPDGVYHVMNRGVERRDIVCDEHDRREWFRLFHRVAKRCGWRVFAHVLMTNHFHIFLRLTTANLSSGMHDLQSGYATLFNKNHERDGVLFQGRFQSLLVESEGYAWSLSRYIHLNPCRARLAQRAEDYHWSTYRFFLDPTDAPQWLDWRTVLCEFGGGEAAARIAYRQYVSAGVEQPPENPLALAYKGKLLGSQAFIEAHRHLIEDAEDDAERFSQSATLDDVLAVVAESFDTSTVEVLRRHRHSHVAREVALWLARETVRVSLTELADAFGISKAAASEAITRCEARQKRSDDLRERCAALRGRVFGYSELAGTGSICNESDNPANSE